MRVNERRVITYTLYLSEEEFEVFQPVTEVVACGYRFDNDRNEFIVTIDSESMLSDVKEALRHEHYVQEYEECNSRVAHDITKLLDDIYVAQHYGYMYDPDDEDGEF